MSTNSSQVMMFLGDGRLGRPAESPASNPGLRKALQKPVDRLANHGVRVACVVLFLILMSSLWCCAADVIFIRSAGAVSSEQRELELATQFYGVNLKIVTANDSNFDSTRRAIRQNTTLAVAIDADALAMVNRHALLGALRGSVPLLILGVTPETGAALLSSWSGGAAVGTQRLESPVRLHYVVGRVAGVTQQLTDLEIPLPGNEAFYFALAEDSKAQEVMGVRNDHEVVPVFIEVGLHQQKVFLLSKTHPAGDSAVEGSAKTTETTFADIAPLMMFIKYCAGDRGWHPLHHYANLTIDDPWLREPYGDLSYKSLLKEMEKHNFYTTIAFIPWNYDRSEAETVSLFRNHPERFSICVHGDNHDHKEFEDLKNKPLKVQIAALRQSLARMEQFRRLTGIPYDKVFVFPHNIGTESVLEGLKTYNFLATINSSNVPTDRLRPTSPLFALRPVTLSFAAFPSISRYPAAMANVTGFLKINDFLDNPLFFYSHHDLFASGIDAFDGMADNVNKLEPDTQWRSVGDIMKHLYLVKLRDGSNYDVLTFSNSFDLDNPTERSLVFHVQKQEVGSPAITSVSVDGQPYPFRLNGGYLDLSVAIPAGAVRSVAIRYKNDLDLALISTSKSSLGDYFLRTMSDFRDITLSKYAVGRALTHYYYKSYDDEEGVAPRLVFVCGSTLILLSLCGGWGLWAVMKRRNSLAVSRDAFPQYKVAPATHNGYTVSSMRARMQKEETTRYVVITPIRDEEKFIETTIASVQGQTIRPAEWVIVNDGSTDRTGEIINRYEAQIPWIRVVHRANRGFRQSGGGVVEAFYDGYKALHGNDWDFIVKLDGDLTLPENYFEKCFEHFERDLELGIGGGEIYHDIGAMQKLEVNPKFHVRGATKIYRRACWEAIGGLLQAPGWDTIDEVKANMLGWKSYSFSDLHVMHHRATGTAEGLLRDRIKHGLACYVSGYHPLFLAASCIFRLAKRPYVTGSAAMCYGFIKGYWTRAPRVNDRQLIKYLRGQQLRRLWGLETIWR